MNDIEAMKQALEKIANVNAMDYEYQRWAREALAIAEAEKQYQSTADKSKLEKVKAKGTLLPEAEKQEPVGEVVEAFEGLVAVKIPVMPPVGTQLYTSPPQRQPLTDEQWQVMADTLHCAITRGQKDIIETALGIKE